MLAPGGTETARTGAEGANLVALLPPESDPSNASNRLKTQLCNRFAALALELGLLVLLARFALLVLRGGGLVVVVFGGGSSGGAGRNFGRHCDSFYPVLFYSPLEMRNNPPSMIDRRRPGSRARTGRRAHAAACAHTRCANAVCATTARMRRSLLIRA